MGMFFYSAQTVSRTTFPLDMEEFLELPKKLPERLELMVKSALEKGCKDNLTVIAIVEA